MQVRINKDAIEFVCEKAVTSISFQRTLRVPEDGKIYPLPPSLGPFPICRVDDYKDTVPPEWKKHGGVFIPMYQREAMWIKFNGNSSHPKACKIAVGKVNVLNGKTWDQKLTNHEDDYLVIPHQPWIDGINSGSGHIKQFVAMPLGKGYTVEGQVTGKEEFGGIQFILYNKKKNRSVNFDFTFGFGGDAGIHFGDTTTSGFNFGNTQTGFSFGFGNDTQSGFSFGSSKNPSSFNFGGTTSGFNFGNTNTQSGFSFGNIQADSSLSGNTGSFGSSINPTNQNNTSSGFSFGFGSVENTGSNFGTNTVSTFSFGGNSGFGSCKNTGFGFGFSSNQSSNNGFGTSNFSFNTSHNTSSFGYSPSTTNFGSSLNWTTQRTVLSQQPREMGISAGGKIKQSIYKDPYGIDFWDENSYARVFVHIVNSAMYEQITGRKPPETPINAKLYTEYGYPWYDIYDEGVPRLEQSEILKNVKSVQEIDKEKGIFEPNNTVNIPNNQVKTYFMNNIVRDGDW